MPTPEFQARWRVASCCNVLSWLLDSAHESRLVPHPFAGDRLF